MPYYKLDLTPQQKKKFINVVHQRMGDMTNAELAKAIGRPYTSVTGFFYNSKKTYGFVGAEIANYFHIQRCEYV
ncbi:MAG: hypothetical protein K6D96_09195 [Acetatifactor sp.]|nr:hypothetical protein [Acetatifactor sp.]